MNETLLHIMFAFGGGLGAVLRHWMTRAITHDLPLSTLLVNVVGCFLLGVGVANLSGSPGLSEEERRLIFGFCGGFTTFSSFAYQSLQLHRERTVLFAAGNILFSFFLCWGAYWIGLSVFAA